MIRVKTVVCSVLATFVFVVFAGYSTVPAVSALCINHGDVTLDGSITASDAQQAFFIVLGTFIPTYEQECAADCNGDGSVTSADAQAIFLVVLGLGDCADPLEPPNHTPTPTLPPFSPQPTNTFPPMNTPTPTAHPELFISAGNYIRGSEITETCRFEREGPPHVVILTRNFYMMRTEVTRSMWAALKSANPALPVDPSLEDASPTMNHPVQQVTWYETILYANLLSQANGYTRCYYLNPAFTIPVDETNFVNDAIYCNFNANGYRLPTEGEWEYAARAGTYGPFYLNEPNYNSGNCNTYFPTPELQVLNSISWWGGNSNPNGGVRSAQPAGTRIANAWGLHDIHGNVWEWCWDWFTDYTSTTVTNPTGNESGTQRVLRGGSWLTYATHNRLAYRSMQPPDTRSQYRGFRLVRTAP